MDLNRVRVPSPVGPAWRAAPTSLYTPGNSDSSALSIIPAKFTSTRVIVSAFIFIFIFIFILNRLGWASPRRALRISWWIRCHKEKRDTPLHQKLGFYLFIFFSECTPLDFYFQNILFFIF